MFLAAVLQCAYTYTPNLVSNTIDDLRATGNLKLIRSPEIKQAMHDYYGFDQSQRQFISLNLMVEFRYFELSAGVITPEQNGFLEDRWFVVHAGNLEELRNAHPEEAGVRAAAGRLQASDELLAWLPQVQRLQTDQINTHSKRLEKAHSLLNALNEYSRRASNKFDQ